MIVVMHDQFQEDHLEAVLNKVEELGFRSHLSRGEQKCIVGIVGNGQPLPPETFLNLPGVERVVPIQKSFKLASRDPSHATGKRELIAPVSRAALAAGADGIMVEVHPKPEEALCDGLQSLHPAEFVDLMNELRPLAQAMGR